MPPMQSASWWVSNPKASIYNRLQAFARGYEEDVEFRMWENSADARIMAAVESACNEYRYMGEDAYGDASNTGLVFECS